MKVVDKMNVAQKAGETFFSFEFFPPRTEEVSPTIMHTGRMRDRRELGLSCI